jgi:uncharacterized membrane protein HdeD (DUF308 family)
MLTSILSRYWWTTLLRGVAWIVFGVIVLALPGVSLVALTLLVGAFLLVDGVTRVISGVGGHRTSEHWWVLLLTGAAGIVVGVLTFVDPAMTALALLLYLAVWAIATGLLEIAVAIQVRREVTGEGWLVLSGLLSVAFGLLVIVRPGVGILSVLGLVAGYAIAFGAVLIVLALRMRNLLREVAGA